MTQINRRQELLALLEEKILLLVAAWGR